MAEDIHFTADTHFDHMLAVCQRRFLIHHYQDEVDAGLLSPHVVERARISMKELLIRRWNHVVSKKGRVYHVGDMFFGKIDWAIEICERLNGRIYLIEGNHDKIACHKKVRSRFEWIRPYERVKIGEQKIYLCHYAFRTWNCMHHGSWNLHGHSHGGLHELPDKLQCDVGVDVWNGYPVSYERLRLTMGLKHPFIPVDHHGARDIR